MAAVGGLGKVSGAVVGSAVVFLLVHGLSRVATLSGMPSTAPIILSYAVYAVLLVSAVLVLPGGLMGLAARAAARVRARARYKNGGQAETPPAVGPDNPVAPEQVAPKHGSFS